MRGEKKTFQIWNFEKTENSIAVPLRGLDTTVAVPLAALYGAETRWLLTATLFFKSCGRSWPWQLAQRWWRARRRQRGPAVESASRRHLGSPMTEVMGGEFWLRSGGRCHFRRMLAPAIFKLHLFPILFCCITRSLDKTMSSKMAASNQNNRLHVIFWAFFLVCLYLRQTC